MSFSDYFKAAAGDPARAMLDLLSNSDGPVSKALLIINMAIFTVAVFAVLWAVLTGTLKTAISGEFLGKKGGLWPIFRMVVGGLGLVPLWGGLTAAQLFIVWISIAGVGLANTVWEAGYNSILSYDSQSRFSASPPVDQNAAVLAILAAQVCAIEVNDHEAADAAVTGDPVVEKVAATETKLGGAGLLAGADFKGISLFYGTPSRPDLCGGARIPVFLANDTATQTREKVIAAHTQALGTLAQELQPMAEKLAHESVAPDKSALVAASDHYKKSVTASLAQMAVQAGSDFGDWISTGDGGSWLYAGTALAKIASINRDIQSAASIKLEGVPAAAEQKGGEVEGLDSVAENAAFKTAGATATQKASFSIKNPDFGALVDPLRSTLIDSVLGWLTQEGGARSGAPDDLMGGLTNLGNKIIIGTLSAISAVLGTLALISGGSLGTLGGLAGGVFTVFVYIFCLPLLGAGLMFAYYLPFLPLVYWVMGVLAWLIIFVEALFGASLWMLAHITSADDQGMGQNSRHGYVFLLNLLFRPSLMIGGLIAGWVIVQFFGGFLRYSLSIFFGSGGSFSGAAGILGFVATLMMFSFLAWQVVNKAFGLIHHVPTEVMNWIGGHAGKIEGGETEMQGRATTVVAGVAKGGAGKGIPGGKPGK